MPDSKCGNHDENTLPIFGQKDRAKGENEQLMIQRVQADDVRPSFFEIKAKIIHALCFRNTFAFKNKLTGKAIMRLRGFLHKRFLAALVIVTVCAAAGRHPIYVSVTEIEHNSKTQALEISCKIFIDDFEKTLRQAYKTRIDLLAPEVHDRMNAYVAGYISKHLTITADGKPRPMSFVGFERIDEGIYAYFEITGVPMPKRVDLKTDLLYEYKSEQISLFHVTVKGERKSTKLVNPEKTAVLEF